MNQHSQQSLEEYLRQSDVQARIWKNIREARENLTVTISRAASLFDFSESKLREWEKRGLLQTGRSILSQEGKGATGHRQYSSAELDKLAIIRELIDQGYTPGEIPSDVDQIWSRIVGEGADPVQVNRVFEGTIPYQADRRSIEQRIEAIDQEEFWRYFVSQALRLSLLLICEDIPDTIAGLILPLEDRKLTSSLDAPNDLPQVGPSLIGWLGRNRSFYSFLTEAPGFEYPTDFRLQTLRSPEETSLEENRALDNVFIVLQRRARPLFLAPKLAETVRRILNLVYMRLESWRSSFEYGLHDWLYQAHDLERASRVSGDRIFNSLLERIVELGGKTGAEEDLWRFCVLLLPRETIGLPIQRQTLVVRAQTRNSPYEVGVTMIDPAQFNSLSQKAFQSGQIIYFANLRFDASTTTLLPPLASPSMIDFSVTEPATRSAIAIPLLGEYGTSVGALYIASNQTEAFSPDDQRVLRVISRMIEELLLTAHGRRQVVGKLGLFVSEPAVVDPLFRGFGSEGDFVAEIEALLAKVQDEITAEKRTEDAISIISIDIDNQSSVAAKYGNRVAKSLSQQVGQRIQGQMRLSNRFSSGNVFHVSVDKYYLLLHGVSLDDARNQAKLLKSILQEGVYRLSPSHVEPDRLIPREAMLELSGITFHLGISSFRFEKLEALFMRYEPEISAIKILSLILTGIDEALNRGKSAGGNCIVTWDEEARGYQFLE